MFFSKTHRRKLSLAAAALFMFATLVALACGATEAAARRVCVTSCKKSHVEKQKAPKKLYQKRCHGQLGTISTQKK